MTLTLTSRLALPSVTGVAAWLTDSGEPVVVDDRRIVLRALGAFLVHEGSQLVAHIDLAASTPVVRLVDLLFDLSSHIGSDLHDAAGTTVTRPTVWFQLAAEQDRIRVGSALARSLEHGVRQVMVQRLWALGASLFPDRDVRWDVTSARFVEVVGEGPVLRSLPDDRAANLLAWRYLSEAWPGVARDVERAR